MNDREEPRFGFGGVLIFSALVVAAMFAVSLWGWLRIEPDARVPTHWGADGKADGYGGRNSLFILPSVAAGMVLLLGVIPRIEPRRGNLRRSSRAYKMMWAGMLVFFSLLHLAMVLVALGHPVSIDRTIYSLMGILFIVMGIAMRTVRSNFFFGVRTPWTLSSELSWKKTHRLASRLFIPLGLVLLAGGLAGARGAVMLWVVLGGTTVLAVAVLVYSYVIWKNDPEKKNGGATGAKGGE